MKARNKAYNARPEIRARKKAQMKAYNARPEMKNRLRERHWRRHGVVSMTVERYDQMFVNQNGVCALCKTAPNGRRLDVDHNHETGEIRGLLCNHCNRMLLPALEQVGFERIHEYLGRVR